MKKLTVSVVAACFLVILATLAIAYPAHAANVAVISRVATLTDERGTCGTGWMVAIRPDRVRGCWTIQYPTYAVTIVWPDGTCRHYSEMEFEIHAELVR